MYINVNPSHTCLHLYGNRCSCPGCWRLKARRSASGCYCLRHHRAANDPTLRSHHGHLDTTGQDRRLATRPTVRGQLDRGRAGRSRNHALTGPSACLCKLPWGSNTASCQHVPHVNTLRMQCQSVFLEECDFHVPYVPDSRTRGSDVHKLSVICWHESSALRYKRVRDHEHSSRFNQVSKRLEF